MIIVEKNTNSVEETRQAGFDFAKKVTAGDIVLFNGELGVGKTEFIKGICQYFKVEESVTSPTFTIINQYYANEDHNYVSILHIDLYRIKENEELTEIGFSEILYDEEIIKLIEWPKNGNQKYPKQKYSVKIIPDKSDENRRKIVIDSEL